MFGAGGLAEEQYVPGRAGEGLRAAAGLELGEMHVEVRELRIGQRRGRRDVFGGMRRDLAPLRSNVVEVAADVRIDAPGGPADAAQKHFQENRVLPDLGRMAHRRVEHASLALHARPGNRIGGALVEVAP